MAKGDRSKKKKRKIEVREYNELPGKLRTGMTHGEYVQSLKEKKIPKKVVLPAKSGYIKFISAGLCESSRRKH